MVIVRPIWLCTCFVKDQAPLIDEVDLFEDSGECLQFWKLGLGGDVDIALRFNEENGLQGGLVKCSLFWTKLLH